MTNRNRINDRIAYIVVRDGTDAGAFWTPEEASTFLNQCAASRPELLCSIRKEIVELRAVKTAALKKLTPVERLVLALTASPAITYRVPA